MVNAHHSNSKTRPSKKGRKGNGLKGNGLYVPYPKGRQADPAVKDEVASVLAAWGGPLEKDQLIEILHVFQDRYGHLSEDHLVALAELLHLPMAHVYEVATFYAHFDVVLAGETPPPAVTVRVCDSLSCALGGGEALLTALRDTVDDAQVRVVSAPCMGRCDEAPVAQIGHYHQALATCDNVLACLKKIKSKPKCRLIKI